MLICTYLSFIGILTNKHTIVSLGRPFARGRGVRTDVSYGHGGKLYGTSITGHEDYHLKSGLS